MTQQLSLVNHHRWKIVILDEADYLTPNAQAALRNLMETYSKTTRFILTCNYVEKIIDPIQSRCQTFGITPPSKKDVAQRLVTVLEEKQVEYDLKDVAAIINSSYPDIRRAINGAQSHVVKGKLTLDKNSDEYAKLKSQIINVGEFKNVHVPDTYLMGWIESLQHFTLIQPHL